MQNAKEIKQKILEIIHANGPSLPVQVAREANIETIFAGAFLSELAGDKAIKISSMKVGGSPLYFLPGQENLLDNFFNYLQGKEKEAFLFLKEKKILRDLEQEPAIRVALRNMKDFAIPFHNDKELLWHFHAITEQEVRGMLEPIIQLPKPEKPAIETQAQIKPETIIKPEIKQKPVTKEIKPEPAVLKEEKIKPKTELEKKGELDIFGEKEKPKEKIKKAREKPLPGKFLEEVKAFLLNKSIELVNLESYNKKEVVAKIRFNLAPEKMHLLVSYNKKRIDEEDILKAHKLALKHKLDYLIFFKGELPKKIKDKIEAYKNLVNTEKVE